MQMTVGHLLCLIQVLCLPELGLDLHQTGYEQFHGYQQVLFHVWHLKTVYFDSNFLKQKKTVQTTLKL